MPTIKDIAKAAGVSQGTVSNVLNGHGNVSLEKMRKVRKAAEQLGYVHNARAAVLRSGVKSGLAVLLPDIQRVAYADFYAGFCEAAYEAGQFVQLSLTGNVPRNELRQLRASRDARLLGVAAVSSVSASGNVSHFAEALGDTRALFIERRLEPGKPFLGFDFARAGDALAASAAADGCKHVGVMTDLICYPCEQAFFQAIKERLRAAGIGFTHVQAIARQYPARAFELCRAGADGVIASCMEMALSVRAAWQAGGEGKPPAVYAISSRRTFLEEGCTAYEMNYRLLGQQACRALIDQTPLPERELPADGLRKKTFAPRVAKEQTLRLLTQNSSFTQALRLLAPGLRRATGLTLKITCFPRNELFDVIEAMGTTDAYDLIRMDMHWMDWYGTRVFAPLDALPLDVNGILQKMVPGMDGEYTSVNGVRYLLPLEPSALLLFYRRDLFEDAATCRSYYETTRKELAVPETFEEYLRVAAFFSQSVHPASRTPYGCTVTHPANEFLSSLLGVLPGGKLRSFEAPECIAQFKRYLQGEQYAYLSATNQWVEAADQFIAGNCAMTILFTNYVEHIVSNPMAYVAGRVGLAKLPGKIPFLGGGVIGVPEASRHKEEAARFLEWAYDDGVSQQLALLSGCSACSVAYENPETKALYPWLDVVKASFAGGIRRGLFEGVRSPFNGKLMENHLGIACRNAADGVMTPEQAMAYAESIYRQLK